MKMKSVTLSDKQIEEVLKKAEKYGITFSDMLRRIIDKYFEDEEKENKCN